LRDSWLEVKGIRKQKPTPIIGETQSIKWEYKRYHQGRKVTPVETLLVDQLKHAWIGANGGNYGESLGPNISEIIWLFFKRHPR
jgi:poly(3-hydroxybutyrate) depolymerase